VVALWFECAWSYREVSDHYNWRPPSRQCRSVCSCFSAFISAHI